MTAGGGSAKALMLGIRRGAQVPRGDHAEAAYMLRLRLASPVFGTALTSRFASAVDVPGGMNCVMIATESSVVAVGDTCAHAFVRSDVARTLRRTNPFRLEFAADGNVFEVGADIAADLGDLAVLLGGTVTAAPAAATAAGSAPTTVTAADAAAAVAAGAAPVGVEPPPSPAVIASRPGRRVAATGIGGALARLPIPRLSPAMSAAVLVVAAIIGSVTANAIRSSHGSAPSATKPPVVYSVAGADGQTQAIEESSGTSGSPGSFTAPLLGAAPPPPPSETALPASSLASDGIPQTALQAYGDAAATEDRADPSCGLEWPLIAAIGRVESDHGRSGGSILHVDGTSTPRIIGVALNGANGTEAVKSTDNGVFDGDKVWAHAIGPMQFLPATWTEYASDGNGDRIDDPFNIFDAALASAKFLCVNGGDLADPAAITRAVYDYDHVDAYVTQVLQLATLYASADPAYVPAIPGPTPVISAPLTLPRTSTAPSTSPGEPPSSGGTPTSPSAPPSTSTSPSSPPTSPPTTPPTTPPTSDSGSPTYSYPAKTP